MSRVVRIIVIAAMATVVMASCQAQGKRIVVGVLPVYDNSGQSLTENLPVNLTYMIYRDLTKSDAYQPVLLSPGALYDPDAVDTITDYATKAKADVTLMHGLAIDAKEGVTFGGSAVGPDGSFSPKPQLTVNMQRGEGTLELPAYTAAYIEL